MESPSIILATGNPGKKKEFQELLGPDFEIVTPKELGLDYHAPAETGHSYKENAFLKVKSIHATYEQPAFADDSGIEIDFLDGAPGLHSARFMNLGSDKERCEKVLELLGDSDNRKAKFVCEIAIYLPSTQSEQCFRGECGGEINFKLKGTHGFGYDPIFIPDGYTETFAELPSEEKNKISHRAKACFQVKDFLKTYLL